MELKQALDLANLRKEHAQLLREKMMVWKKIIISNRIGTLHALSASLAASEELLPVHTYLNAAYLAGISLPAEPDWHAMDYSEIVSVEAFRSAKFGNAVAKKLAALRRDFQNASGADGLNILGTLLADQFRISDNGHTAVSEVQNFSEFLEARSDATISVQHISWLAFLIWLHDAGYSLNIEKSGNDIQFTLQSSVTQTSINDLVGWIQQMSV